MRWKQIEAEPKTFVPIFETGEEIANALPQFARKRELAGSGCTAIGALSRAKLGWFNGERKKYEPACVLNEQVELLSLTKDIARKDRELQVHAQVLVGRSRGTAHGGRLLAARVRPAGELPLTESPIHLRKKTRSRIRNRMDGKEHIAPQSQSK
jgi:predicted DNA-binding protein with PD1-like motif